MKIKKGDNVMMLSGKDRAKKGVITSVDRAANKIIVEGLNMIKRHTRARKQGQKGQIITKERFVSASSVAIICPSCGKQTRIGIKMSEGSKAGKVRICRKCKAEI